VLTASSVWKNATCCQSKEERDDEKAVLGSASRPGGPSFWLPPLAWPLPTQRETGHRRQMAKRVAWQTSP